jgi:hypothetical protein
MKKLLVTMTVVVTAIVSSAAAPRAEAVGGAVGGIFQCPAHAPVLRVDWTGWAWCSPY